MHWNVAIIYIKKFFSKDVKGHISHKSKDLDKIRDKFLHSMKEPYVLVGHISPLMTLTHVILRRISPTFWLTAGDISPVMDIRYDEQKDIILPFLKNCVKTRTNFTKWSNECMKLWDTFLPSWNELTSNCDKFLPFLKIWLD